MKMHGELALQFRNIFWTIVYYINTGEDLPIEILLKSVQNGQAKGLDWTEDHIEYVVRVILVLDYLLVLEDVLSLNLIHRLNNYT